MLTVRLYGKGVCKSSAESLLLGATQYFTRRKGQLIYGKQNFHNGAIDIIPSELDGGITSKDIPTFNINNSTCNPKFLLHQLKSPQYYEPAEIYTTGTGSKRLKEEAFLKMEIYLPELNIQNRIANTLNSLDKRTSIELMLYFAYLNQRKYLLQQMFI